MITPRHWRVPPHLDARTSLPPAQRGELAPERLGRAPAALARALVRLGQERPAKGHRWRLPPEVFDAAARTMRGKGGAR